MLGQVLLAAVGLLPACFLLCQCEKGEIIDGGGRVESDSSESTKVPQKKLLEEMSCERGGVDQVEPGGVLHQGEPPVHTTDESVS